MGNVGTDNCRALFFPFNLGWMERTPDNIQYAKQHSIRKERRTTFNTQNSDNICRSFLSSLVLNNLGWYVLNRKNNAQQLSAPTTHSTARQHSIRKTRTNTVSFTNLPYLFGFCLLNVVGRCWALSVLIIAGRCSLGVVNHGWYQHFSPKTIFKQNKTNGWYQHFRPKQYSNKDKSANSKQYSKLEQYLQIIR